MIWSDAKIKESIETGLIDISPFDEKRLQPNSIDLILDDEILFYDREYDEFEKDKISNYDFPYLVPGAFILASTVEHISLGNGVCAQVDGKSSFGRKGLQVHQTAGFIDAGFSGNITLEMTTIGQPIKLEVGMPICQLVFWDAYPSDKPYGSEGLGSHYQGQLGVTKSWM